MDDLLKSVPDDDDAIQLASELMVLLRRGGFSLTKWISSSKNVLATIPASERADPTLNLSIDKLPILRALGIQCGRRCFPIKDCRRRQAGDGKKDFVNSCFVIRSIGFRRASDTVSQVITTEVMTNESRMG